MLLLLISNDIFSSLRKPQCNENLKFILKNYIKDQIREENLGGVYMIPGRLASRREFTAVPSCDSVFVYVIPKQNVMPARVIPARVHPGSCAGARFSSRHENSFRCHVNGV